MLYGYNYDHKLERQSTHWAWEYFQENLRGKILRATYICEKLKGIEL
jgi:hypothetical protein